ncbi:mitotic spindle assembly checkpoint protein mad2b [Nannochloropsis oceanica]
MKQDDPLQEATAVLLEFLEVAVHQVLYNRGVYPSAVFERRRKYDVPVFMSRHPDLNLYIHEVMQAAGGMLMEGSIDKIVLTLYGSSNNDAPQTPLESFAFELLSSPLLIQALAEGSLEDPFPAFRKVLARISIAEEVAELAPVPHDVTFAILLATRPHHQQQQQQQQRRQANGGKEGGQEGVGLEVPPAWTAAISSGEFAPGGPESYLATTIEGKGGGGGRYGIPEFGELGEFQWRKKRRRG